MRNFEVAIATTALAALPLLAGGRTLAWFVGPFSDWQSRAAIAEDAPEIRHEEGYVSSRECRACHPAAYRTWHDSYHRTMTQLATPEAVVGDFDDVELTVDVPASAGVGGSPRTDRYRLSRRDDEYWVTRLAGDSARPDEHARIAMTTGSHHHQIIWVSNASNDRLVTLPWTYLIGEQRWIPRTDAFLAPPDDPFGISYWTDTCIECHATRGRPRVAGDGALDDARVTELGIACEMCHGPAGPHVAANRAPWRRWMETEQDEQTIVNPERLSARRASHVCGRCHSIVSYPHSLPGEGHWNAFEPGEDLGSEGRVIVDPGSDDPVQRSVVAQHERAADGRWARERFWSDGAVRVAGRELADVLASPCFAGGEFSCLSCHSLHDYESTDDQLARGMRGDAACLQCHERYGEDPSSHTRHPAASAGSRCGNCHMPYTTYGLHKAIRSHRVSSPSVGTELATGGPNACNACHLDQSLAWTQDRLVEDYGVAPVPLDERARDVPAGPRWIATGDAGVRALAAWYLGWDAARSASGSDWMAPYAAELLADPYAAVRAVAWSSLRTIPGYEQLDYDFVSARGELGQAARRRVQARWAGAPDALQNIPPGPLLAAGRELDQEAWKRLMQARDTRPISLSE